MENTIVYITKCESRWPMLAEVVRSLQVLSEPNTRRWADNQEDGRLPLHKRRFDCEGTDVQEDKCEDEEKLGEATESIMAEDIERQLTRAGHKYAKENVQRVLEERITNQAKVEMLQTRLEQVLQVAERQKEHISQAEEQQKGKDNEKDDIME